MVSGDVAKVCRAGGVAWQQCNRFGAESAAFAALRARFCVCGLVGTMRVTWTASLVLKTFSSSRRVAACEIGPISKLLGCVVIVCETVAGDLVRRYQLLSGNDGDLLEARRLRH